MGSVGTTGRGGGVVVAESTEESSVFTPESISDIRMLQSEMGQTGYEAGDPNATPREKLYVNTGKSFCINTYLNTDGETYKAPSKLTDWGDLISESWVKDAIQKIDSGMKPLSRDIAVSRFLDADGFKAMTGIDVNSRNMWRFLNKLESNPGAKADFETVLRDTDYTQKAYTSTTYAKTHGTYGENPVKLNIIARKGTPAIITNNHAESEILIGRNRKYRFGDSFRVTTLPSGKKQLVLDVYI